MRQPEYYAAVFAIIKNKDWEILFQQRKNTGFRDGEWQLPSGHIELWETSIHAIIRELYEELAITIQEMYSTVVHVAHTIQTDRIYFNIYVEISQYTWELQNMEPEKCSEISFFSLEIIRDNPLFSYEIETLERIERWEYFSEKIY